MTGQVPRHEEDQDREGDARLADVERIAIRCPHCDVEFKTDGLLEDHLQRAHDESGP